MKNLLKIKTLLKNIPEKVLYDFDLLKLLREVQINAVEVSLELAAKSATTKDDPNSYAGNTGSECSADIIVDTKSILDCRQTLINQIYE